MKIRNYPINQNLSNQDMLLGTDSNGLTKNFLMSSIAEFTTSASSPSIILASDLTELQTHTPTRPTLGVTVDNNKLFYYNSSWIAFGNGISATTIYVSANPVVGLNTVVAPGTAIKISYDSYGRVLSGQSLTSADIPNIDMSKVISGQLDWNRLSNVLFATSSSNGIITSSDWNTFNNKLNSNEQITFTNGLSATTSFLSASPTIGLVSIGIPGEYTKFSSNQYGQVISGSILVSGDIPTIPPSKILEDSNDRFVSDTQISYWNSLSAATYPVSSIDISETIGDLQWNRLNGIPVATTNTNGVLTSSDWNTFNNKSNVSSLNNYLPLSGGNITSNISAVGFVDTNFVGGRVLTSNSQTITESTITNTELSYLLNVSGNIQAQINELSQNSLSGTGVGTVGKISKFVTSSSVSDSSISDSGSLVTFSTPITVNGDVSASTFTGLASRATSALQADTLKTNRTFSLSGDVSSNVVSFNGSSNVVLSGTISNLSPTKISQDINNRFVTDTQITSWTGNTTSVQANSANWNTAFTSAHNHSNKSTLDLINQSLNTSASVSFNTVSATNISATSLTIGNISNTEFNYLDTVSANIQTQLGNISALDSAKAPLTRNITTTSGLTGGGDLTSNRTIGLIAVGTSGTYTNVVTNAYGQVTSARTIISADIPTIPPSKILEDSNDRFVSDSQISYWNSLSATSFAVSSINISSTSGSLNWTRVSAVPVASTNTSGVLTSADWNTFNNKVGSLSALNNYFPLSGGNINGNLSANNISATILTVGNISNTEFNYLDTVSANIQTQLTNLSARTITSADVPQLPPSKITTNTTNRFVTDSQIAQWDANISGTSAIVDLESSLIIEANKNKLYLLSGSTTTVTSSVPSATNFAQSLSPIFAGKREKTFIVIGPTSGTYQATVVFYGTDINRSSWVYPDNCIIGTINNSNNIVSADFSNKFTVWGASLTIDSGTIPYPGVSATVEV
jgi:hypothetical protein